MDIFELLTKWLDEHRSKTIEEKNETLSTIPDEGTKNTPIDDKNVHKDFEILHKNENDISLSEKILQLDEKCKQQEGKISELEQKIVQMIEEDRQKSQEVNKMKLFLSALKDKSKDMEFYNIEDYVEESLIGKGATSTVKLVHKKEKYAKKELNDLSEKNPQRFFSESEILFQLHHPCLIKIYGFNNGDSLHFPSIILEFEPNSLEKAIKNDELNNHQKNKITVELVLGMRYIHSKNIMHRDLKPANILLSKKLHVRITDFGLAKEDGLEASLTKGIGTLRFMAPELLNEGDTVYTNKVDVYSFGITLIYIVTGNFPKFNLMTVGRGSPSIPGKVVPWVNDLINRCVSVSPENRPSFNEILEIMKENNYDLFNETKDTKLTSSQKSMKQEIESRILKIEAYEFQHQ